MVNKGNPLETIDCYSSKVSALALSFSSPEYLGVCNSELQTGLSGLVQKHSRRFELTSDFNSS